MTPTNKKNTELHMINMDVSPDARWKDDYSAQRSSITIFDLVDAQNIRARSIAHEVDSGDIELAKQLSKTPAPLSVINDLMKQSNLGIKIEVQRGEEITARKGDSEPFSIAHLSDGERNALLIAASVLTARPSSVILIDEPERHLHRSIISPLLTLLFASRPDCGFVVSTHDVGLPLDNKTSQTLIVRSCRYSGTMAVAWDAELIPPAGGIDDDIRTEILGSREKLIFVEGNQNSLDQSLYNIVFPKISVIPKKTCRDVEHYVGSIRHSASLHWLSAWGIVDKDTRSEDDCNRLRRQGVFPLETYSVEAIYYSEQMIRRMAVRHAEVTGGDPAEIADIALSRALDILATHQDRLSERMSEGKIRAKVFEFLPTMHSIRSRESINISINVKDIIEEETILFQTAISQKNINWLLGRYPIRETQALDAIVKALGFKDREVYENSVRKYIMDDSDALRFVRGNFSELLADMSSQSGTTAVSVL